MAWNGNIYSNRCKLFLDGIEDSYVWYRKFAIFQKRLFFTMTSLYFHHETIQLLKRFYHYSMIIFIKVSFSPVFLSIGIQLLFVIIYRKVSNAYDELCHFIPCNDRPLPKA